MKREFEKQKINPVELMNSWGWEVDHITFNPNIKESDCGFFRHRRATHDGTLIFTQEMLQNLLLPLANKEKYSKKYPPVDWKLVKDIHYQVGFIKLAMVFGEVDLPVGKT